MSAKSFLKIALDLQLPNLHEKLVSTLLKQVKLVPCAISHAASVRFSPSAFTFIMKGNLTSAVTREDAQRLINAAMPTLSDRFPTITKKDRKKVLHDSPHLIYCVKRVVNTMKGGTKHLILFVCVTAVLLADRLGVITGCRPNISTIYRATNMSRHITLQQIENIIDGETGTRIPAKKNFQVVVNKIAIPRGTTSCRMAK